MCPWFQGAFAPATGFFKEMTMPKKTPEQMPLIDVLPENVKKIRALIRRRDDEPPVLFDAPGTSKGCAP